MPPENVLLMWKEWVKVLFLQTILKLLTAVIQFTFGRLCNCCKESLFSRIIIRLFYISSNTFHILRPAKAPGFAYAWLELVSHRVIIGRMLAITPQQRVSYVGICAICPILCVVVVYQILTLFILLALCWIIYPSMCFYFRDGICMLNYWLIYWNSWHLSWGMQS